jgi:hypothetical protein
MPVSRLAAESGVLDSDDLDLCQRAFAAACREFPTPPDAETAQEIAARIMMAFRRGFREEHELVREGVLGFEQIRLPKRPPARSLHRYRLAWPNIRKTV